MKKFLALFVVLLLMVYMPISYAEYTENIDTFILRYNSAAEGYIEKIVVSLYSPGALDGDVFRVMLNQYVGMIIGVLPGTQNIEGVVLMVTGDGTRESVNVMLNTIAIVMNAYGFIDNAEEVMPFFSKIGLNDPKMFNGEKHQFFIDDRIIEYTNSEVGLVFVIKHAND